MMDFEDTFLPILSGVAVVAALLLFGFGGVVIATNSIEDQCEKFGAFYIDDTRYTCEAVD